MAASIDEGNRESIPPGHPFVPTQDPDEFETRAGGGWLPVVGLPFLALGLFILCFFGPFLPRCHGGMLACLFYIFLGVVFTAAGAVLVIGRSGLTVNRRTGVIVRQQSLIVPIRRTKRALADLRRVTLAKHPGDSATPVTYPVRLEGDAIKPIEVFAPRITGRHDSPPGESPNSCLYPWQILQATSMTFANRTNSTDPSREKLGPRLRASLTYSHCVFYASIKRQVRRQLPFALFNAAS
jgi:hypothetical protein